MSVRILKDQEDGYSCLYCSTTGIVFGEIFSEDEDANEFLEWLPIDARKYSDRELRTKIAEWRTEIIDGGE